MPVCRGCLEADTSTLGEPDLYSVPTWDGARQLVGLCAAHARSTGGAVEVSLGQVSARMGVETTWADLLTLQDALAAVEAPLTVPNLTGPLAGERHVRQLRMGQRGFVSPQALRVDASGRLLVDRDAPAPQRGLEPGALAIQRAVGGGGLEVTIITAEAHLWEAIADRARTPGAPRREQVVGRITGLRHAPALAARLQVGPLAA